MNTRLAAPLAVLLSMAALIPQQTSAQESSGTDQARLSREERMRLHEERVKQILEQRRQERAQQDSLQKIGEVREARAAERGEAPAEPAAPAQSTFGNLILYSAIIDPLTGDAVLDGQCSEGQRFVSEVRLQNQNSRPFERISLSLQYDKRFLRPVKIFDESVRPSAYGKPQLRLLERDGLLAYDVRFATPQFSKELTVLKIVWEAHRATDHTAIRFRFSDATGPDAMDTAVFFQQKDILGDEADDIDGVLSSSLFVAKESKPGASGHILQGKREELREIYLGALGAKARAGLELIGPASIPAVGQEFEVAVSLNNPAGAQFDSLSLQVQFDPEVLEVVDQDRGNWIKTGVNVHDGPYRDAYPFDFLKRNVADNRRGIIHYAMASREALPYPSGTFATIRFRARKAVDSTDIALATHDRETFTTVRSFGYDLLSMSEGWSKPTFSTPVLIDPPAGSTGELLVADQPASGQGIDPAHVPASLRDPRLLMPPDVDVRKDPYRLQF